MIKKLLIILVIILFVLIVGGIGVALFLNKVSAPSDTTNLNIITITPTVTSTITPIIAKVTVTSVPKIQLTLSNNGDGTFSLLADNPGLAIEGFQLNFLNGEGILSFESNPIFDTALSNEVSTDGRISIAFGKFTNTGKQNEDTINGKEILGTFVLKSGFSSVSLDIDESKVNLLVDNIGSKQPASSTLKN